MRKIRFELLMLSLTALILLSPAGCSDEDPAAPGDTTSPNAVTDLRVASVTDNLVTLAWTAPGDDGNTGTASAYDLRYSNDPITAGNWAACTPATTEPDPAASGTGQVAIIDTGGKAAFHFALKTADEASNWSGLSNVVMASVAEDFVVQQLTTTGHNIHPCLDDGHVVWVLTNGIDGDEIYIANLENPIPTPTRLTDNGGEKARPNNHGAERIVWSGRGGPSSDWEIWIYDRYTVPRFRQLTDNEVHDRYPDLSSAGSFAWLQETPLFEEVHYWHESSHSESVISSGCCPADTWANEIPSADDGAVVWRSYDQIGGEGFRANFWNGALTNLTDTIEAHLAYDYSLYAGTIAFEVWDGHDWEIHFWDGMTIHEITDNEINDTEVSLHGSMIAWMGRPSGGVGQIYYASVAK